MKIIKIDSDKKLPKTNASFDDKMITNLVVKYLVRVSHKDSKTAMRYTQQTLLWPATETLIKSVRYVQSLQQTTE